MGTLSGRTALVTGGTSGIGLATARLFAAEGAAVVVAGRREAEGEEAARAIEAEGGRALFVAADVTREPDVRALVERTMLGFGRLDIAFNNAGGGRSLGPFGAQTEASFRLELDTNLTSKFLCLKQELAVMGAGSVILNTASVGGVVGMAGAAPYIAALHGVVGLTRATALEYAPRGVRINALVLGCVDTPVFRRAASSEGAATYLAGLHPIGRIATPEEIARAALFLCSEAASFITGAAIPVDGGYTAR